MAERPAGPSAAPEGVLAVLESLRRISSTLERTELLTAAKRALEALAPGHVAELVPDAAAPAGADDGVIRVALDGEGYLELRRVDDEGGAEPPPRWALEAFAAQLRVSLDLASRHAQLRQSEEQLWSLLDNTSVVVFIKDLDGRYVLVNRQLERDTGITREQMLGKTDDELFDAKTAARLRADDLEVIASGGPQQFEGTTEYPGGPRVFLTTKYPLRDHTGQIYALCGIAADITARKRAEKGQQLDAIGQLAGGIAHDFNNMLTGLLAAAEMLDLDLPDEREEGVDDSIRMIVDAAQQAADLTRKLVVFSRGVHHEHRPIEVHEAVEVAAALLRRGIDKRVELELRLGAPRSTIEGNSSQLQTAVVALGLNANDAMPEGGRLVITTRERGLDAAACEASSFAIEPGLFLELEMRDTGVGIVPELVSRVFEPYFTTKPIGRGTGLGLAAVRSTVIDHGGAVELDSTLGEGTGVRLLLPLAGAAEAAHGDAGAAAGAAADAPVGGTILLVDDEHQIRHAGRRMLENLGYRVLLAEDGREGVECFTQCHADIDVVLLDMIMPEMDGREAFIAMQDINPEVPIIVCSGYASEAAIRELEGRGLAGFVAKPYRRGTLVDEIERCRRRRPDPT